ncbi:MAG TPA: M1 family metallopeptidase [Chitinophagales bacterium]|nr:M1 family metallopeptidase [Chitinophagales bacterium]
MGIFNNYCKNFFFTFTFILIFTFLLQGQNLRSYFQQEVNYTINVRLDDVHHFLHGDISIEYANNSPDTLHYVMFHLWPNAYKDNFTAFAKQFLENGSTKFYYAPDSIRGFIDSLNIQMNGLKTIMQYDSINPDIAKVNLPVPLYPGKKAIFYTPFRVKIPFTFSRLGHVKQQYQISQWYPKPAVYDQYGWHAIPYLDQGEFYSEFGSFDVHITLPKNYVVGATGVLQNESEKEWLNKKAEEGASKYPVNYSPAVSKKNQTTPFPSSDAETKTLHYVAGRVHDFAWFADKRYEVMKSSVRLPHTNHEVTTWSLFLPEDASSWSKATLFADSGLWYYSKWIGDYPYPQATVVDGALSAGGGMEYPMITVISAGGSKKQLDEVIAHELGHNWFFAVLAFNEREHPWMDEGINSYYENRYIETRYPTDELLPHEKLVTNLFDLHYPHHYEFYLSYLYFAKQHNDQVMDQNATQFTELNYAVIAYAKTAEEFRYLQSYLGAVEYDSIMQIFFSEWKFRHPYPEDLKNVFEENTNKELDWFFKQIIPTTDYLDYKLKKEDVGLKIGESQYAQIKVKNNARVKGPYSIAAYKDRKKVRELWYGGFNGEMSVLFPEGDYDYFKLDADGNLPETNRRNNFLKRKGLLKKMEPLKLQWLGSVDNPDRTQIFYTPIIGGNYYDGFTPGLALYNSVFFPKKVNFVLVPQYGLHSGNFVGIANINIPFYFQNSFLHSVTFSSTAKSYTYATTSNFGDTAEVGLRFMRWAQHLSFDLKKKNPRSSVDQKFDFKNIFLRAQQPGFNGIHDEDRLFNLLSYSYNERRVINPFYFTATAEMGNISHSDYAKLYLGGRYIISYPKKKRGMEIRLFTGFFLQKPKNNLYDFRLSATTGLDDYRFDEIFKGRSEHAGFYSQQISIADDGGFKMRTDGVQPRIGESNSWILSLNLKAPLPFFSPLFVFADGGFAPNDNHYDVFQYDAGAGLTLVPNVVEIYLPLFFSSDIKKNLTTTDFYNKWYERITFTFNIDRLNPFELIRNFRLN